MWKVKASRIFGADGYINFSSEQTHPSLIVKQQDAGRKSSLIILLPLAVAK